MSDSAVYVADDVAAVRVLWARSGALAGSDIVAQLAASAGALVAAHSSGELGASVLIRNWWRQPHDDARSKVLSELRARAIVARDHGYPSWSVVHGSCDPVFERAVDAVVLGQVHELHRLLAEQPALVRGRSAYGHHATLLHYVAANGVEIRRQMVPGNAPEIATALLAGGADCSATIEVYGGSLDTLALLRSSAHPRAAGVADEIGAVLARAT